MHLPYIFIFVFIFFVLHKSEEKNIPVGDENDVTKNGEDNYFDVDLDNLSLLPNPMELYEYINGEDNKINVKPFNNLKGALKKRNLTKETFLELYKSALSHFDIDGYTFLMEKVMSKEYGNKFLQKKKKKTSYTHIVII